MDLRMVKIIGKVFCPKLKQLKGEKKKNMTKVKVTKDKTKN